MPDKFQTMANWIKSKSNPVLILLTGAGTLVALVSAFLTNIESISQFFDRRHCLTYASGYRGVSNLFKKEGGEWVEYQSGTARFKFEETGRDGGYLYLHNKTERPENPEWATLAVRLPRCGGEAGITSGLPQRPWVRLADVWPE